MCRSRRELSNEYLRAKIGVDTAENEPLEVHLMIQPWDLIFTEPPRPAPSERAQRREKRELVCACMFHRLYVSPINKSCLVEKKDTRILDPKCVVGQTERRLVVSK